MLKIFSFIFLLFGLALVILGIIFTVKFPKGKVFTVVVIVFGGIVMLSALFGLFGSGFVHHLPC